MTHGSAAFAPDDDVMWHAAARPPPSSPLTVRPLMLALNVPSGPLPLTMIRQLGLSSSMSQLMADRWPVEGSLKA